MTAATPAHPPSSRTLPFVKMHGLGNDFMVIDARTEPFRFAPEQIRLMADRHRGIGWDQLLVVEPPPEKVEVDYTYRIFNADGSEASQCGNGARCMALFLHRRGVLKEKSVRLFTRGGIITATLLADGRVRVDMGVPQFAAEKIPFNKEVTGLTSLPNGIYQLTIDGAPLQFTPISMGNPHLVIKVSDVAHAPLAMWAAALQSHAAFPQSVNVGVAEIVDTQTLRLRVFERGVGETLACGSGACAAAAVAIHHGWTQSPLTIHMLGGFLRLEWNGGTIAMTGPAVEVFSGEIVLS